MRRAELFSQLFVNSGHHIELNENKLFRPKVDETVRSAPPAFSQERDVHASQHLMIEQIVCVTNNARHVKGTFTWLIQTHSAVENSAVQHRSIPK
jgi:hypothetical protein